MRPRRPTRPQVRQARAGLGLLLRGTCPVDHQAHVRARDQKRAAIAAARAGLAALLRVARLEAIVTGLQRQLAEPAEAVAFVGVIASATRGRVFSAGELVAHAQVDAGLRRVIGDRTSRQIGKRLRAVVDRPSGGYIVRRIGRDGSGSIWAVQVLDHLHGGAGLGLDAGV